MTENKTCERIWVLRCDVSMIDQGYKQIESEFWARRKRADKVFQRIYEKAI